MPSPFDKNLLPEFDSVKNDNEEIMWIGKPLFLPYALSSLWSGVGLVSFIFFGIILSKCAKNQDGSKVDLNSNWIFILPVLFFLAEVVYKLFSFSNTSYAYTNRRVMMRTGFIGTSFKSIDYDKISDIEVTVSFIERYFNVGTIKFFSGRTQTDEGKTTKLYDNWEAIANPYEVFKLVKKVSVDIKTDYNYPNALRPESNPGYNTKYNPNEI